MTASKQIGELLELNTKTVEWSITDFFSYTGEDVCFASPDFSLSESMWHIEIYPNGQSSKQTKGSVSVFLNKNDIKFQKLVKFTFAIRAVDGELKNKVDVTWYPNEFKGYGTRTLVKKSELLEKKLELVPSGTLTISCWVHVTGDILSEDTRLNKLVADLKDLFTSKRNSDVTIKVKEEMFSAHKSILTARSPVLAAMFENEMIEKRTGFVNIPDCDPAAFKHFLLYLYCGELDSKDCDFFLLYQIADKYSVLELKIACVKFMIPSISLGNICKMYVLGHQFNDTELLTSAQNFFNDNFEKVISSDEWMSLLEEDRHLANNLLKGIVPKVKTGK